MPLKEDQPVNTRTNFPSWERELLSPLEAISPKSRCGQAWRLRQSVSRPSPSSLWLHPSSLPLLSHYLLFCMSVGPNLPPISLRRTPVPGFRATLCQHDLLQRLRVNFQIIAKLPGSCDFGEENHSYHQGRQLRRKQTKRERENLKGMFGYLEQQCLGQHPQHCTV